VARRARTRIIAGSWRLPLVVLVGVLLAGAMVALYGGLNRHPAAQTPRAVTGVVIASEPCAQAGARDTVRVQIDGRTERLPVNACGNPTGFQLELELLTAEDGALTARLAGTAGQPSSDLAARISAVLLVLAGLAGAALVMQLAPGSPPIPTPMPVAGAPPGTDSWSAPLYPTPMEVGSATVGTTPVVWPTEEPPPEPVRDRPAVAWPTEEPDRTRPPANWPAPEPGPPRPPVSRPAAEPNGTRPAPRPRVGWPAAEPGDPRSTPRPPVRWPAEEPAEITDPYLSRRRPGPD
jgi:hypothetical protein